jgi:YD repeat-containing protein
VYSYSLVPGPTAERATQTTVTEALTITTKTRADIWGRTVEVRPPLDPWTRYTYDERDRLTMVEQMNGESPLSGFTTSLSYDYAGRKTQMDDPDMGLWSYTYDALGNLTGQTDARGCTITFDYDDLNRLIEKRYSGGGVCEDSTVTYFYDSYSGDPIFSGYAPPQDNPMGRRTGMKDASGHTLWAYDARGRVVQEQKTITGAGTFITSWSYNAANQVLTMQYPGGNNGEVGSAAA